MTADHRTSRQKTSGDEIRAASACAAEPRARSSADEAKPNDAGIQRRSHAALLGLSSLLGRSAARAALAQHTAEEAPDDEEAEESRR